MELLKHVGVIKLYTPEHVRQQHERARRARLKQLLADVREAVQLERAARK